MVGPTPAPGPATPAHDRTRLSQAEFDRLVDEVRAWDPSRPGERRGALRFLTPARVAAAAALVRTGHTISLGRVLDTRTGPHNPVPADHHMTLLPTEGAPAGAPEGTGLHFAKDFIGVDFHNDTHSHVDALSHVAYDGRLFGGAPATDVTVTGAKADTIEVLRDGLIGRGVLLDVPRVRDVLWLEPGENVMPEDLVAAEARQGVEVGPGDVLLVRTGHGLRLEEVPPYDPGPAKPGLHPSVARFLRDRRVAALGSDGNSDTAPSAVDGVGYPMHVLALHALGLHLLDYLALDDVADHAEATGRCAFLFVALPLRIAHGTGSPVNPVAVF